MALRNHIPDGGLRETPNPDSLALGLGWSVVRPGPSRICVSFSRSLLGFILFHLIFLGCFFFFLYTGLIDYGRKMSTKNVS